MQRRIAKLDENGTAAKGTNAQVADPHHFKADPDPDPACGSGSALMAIRMKILTFF